MEWEQLVEDTANSILAKLDGRIQPTAVIVLTNMQYL